LTRLALFTIVYIIHNPGYQLRRPRARDYITPEHRWGKKGARRKINMADVFQIGSIVLLFVTVILLLMLLRRLSQTGGETLARGLDAFEKMQERIDHTVRDEGIKSRDEMNKAAREQRLELTAIVNNFGDSVAQRIIEVSALQKGQLEIFSDQLSSFAKASGERLDAVRSEAAGSARQLREEVVATLSGISETMATTLKNLADVQKTQLEAFSGQIAALTRTTGEKLDGVRTEGATGAKQLREEVLGALKAIAGTVTNTMGELSNTQKVQLERMTSEIGKLSDSTERKLEAVRVGVEGKLQGIQVENANQLELMRQTVDEKLQGTLEKRLGDSFKQVSERLEQVHKGFGEMQALATGVGDLKKVLTNVKTRGTWAEVQLGTMLEQMLNPDQFAANVATRESGERVEFAIKLPGQGGGDEPVWLPIDAKFPVEDYQRLMEAQEKGDVEGVEIAAKQLEYRVKASAREICEKYLNPPRTTDFAIMFLPIEGLFAEVIRRNGLYESIQRECRVVIAGPTTLWSILNSIQMGFRTLAIQKRSSEVWNLLAAVKTEWTKYGDILEAVQKKLNQAAETIDRAKTRSRAIGRKLKDVQELPGGETTAYLLGSAIDESDEENDDMAADRLRVSP
jgi:DNA recombination protein RmuC